MKTSKTWHVSKIMLTASSVRQVARALVAMHTILAMKTRSGLGKGEKAT
jgi:hypothetical protein